MTSSTQLAEVRRVSDSRYDSSYFQETNCPSCDKTLAAGWGHDESWGPIIVCHLGNARQHQRRLAATEIHLTHYECLKKHFQENIKNQIPPYCPGCRLKLDANTLNSCLTEEERGQFAAKAFTQLSWSEGVKYAALSFPLNAIVGGVGATALAGCGKELAVAFIVSKTWNSFYRVIGIHEAGDATAHERARGMQAITSVKEFVINALNECNQRLVAADFDCTAYTLGSFGGALIPLAYRLFSHTVEQLACEEADPCRRGTNEWSDSARTAFYCGCMVSGSLAVARNYIPRMPRLQ